MGMFDYIKFEMPCPKCGTRVKDFQSKDGACILSTLEFWEVESFYSYCPECHVRIIFTYERSPIPITDYKMIVD